MFYIFHGNDTFSQRETMADLLGRLGDPVMLELNTTRLPGNATVGELRQVCDVMPFLAPVRLVIVEDMLAGSSAELVDQLLAYLPNLPETTRLVFLESQSLRANHRLLRFAEKAENGYVRQFSRPEGNALNRWIEKRFEAQGGSATPQAVHTLAMSIGNDLALLENEIEKLVLYRRRGGRSRRRRPALPLHCGDNIFDPWTLGSRQATGGLAAEQELAEGPIRFTCSP